MADTGELSFVATMRDEATRIARSVRSTMDSIGGDTKPIETAVRVDGDQAKAGIAEAEAAFDGIVPAAKSAGDKAGSALASGVESGLSSLKGVVAGGIAAFGIGTAISESMDISAGRDKLAASLGATGRDAKAMGDLAGDLYSGAWGESMDDVNTAVAAVKTSIRGLGTGAELRTASEQALNYASIFDVDVTRAAQVAGQAISTGLAKNSTQAFDLMTAAAQKVPVALREDVLDAADEYGTFFAALGFDGPQAFGALAAGASKGMYGIDKTGDAIKEFTILSTDMSASSQAAYKSIGLDAGQMANDVLAGGDKAKGAFDKTVRGLLGIKDPAKRANAAIALFGTPLEDIGTKDIPKFLRSMISAEGGLGKVAGAAKRSGDTLNDNARTNLTSFARQAKMAFVDVIGGEVLPILDSVASALAVGFGPALDAVGASMSAANGFFREHESIAKGLAIVIAVLAAATAAHGAVLSVTAAGGMAAWLRGTKLISGATRVWAAVQWILNSALLANPIGLAVVAIVALVAAVVLAWRNSERFRAIVIGVWNAIKSGVTSAVSAVKGAIGAAWAWIQSATSTAWNAVKKGVSAAVSGVVGFVRSHWRLLIAIILGPLGIILGLVISNWGRIRKATTTAFAAVKAAISRAWSAVKATVSRVVSVVVGVVRAGFNNLRNNVSRVMSLVRSVVTAAWGKIRSAFSSAVSKVVSVARAGFNNLRNNISRAMALVRSVVTGAWSRIRSAFSSAMGAIRNAVSSGMGRVRSAISSAMATARSVVSSAWSRIKSAFSSGVSAVVGIARGIGGKIKSGLGSLFGVGADLVRGLISGITSLAGNVASAARNVVSNAISAAKSALKIGSPSRVFREIGAWTSEGLALGIDDQAGQAVASAADMASRVASAGIPSLVELADLANNVSGIRPVATARTANVVTIRHEIVSPDRSVSDLTAAQVADVIARDPRSAAKIERALRPQRRKIESNTLESTR